MGFGERYRCYLCRVNEPRPPKDVGPLSISRTVFRWDLDKTYLRTEFDTVRDLVRTAFEGAAQKRAVPGASALLREIGLAGPAGVHILSGSPEQMRRVLESKLRLDGIRWDSFVLKPSLARLIRGQFRFLKDQVGYKLSRLLDARAAEQNPDDEVLFGDDSESDAFVYTLFAELCAGHVTEAVLRDVLLAARVHEEDIPLIVAASKRVAQRDSCRKIFIHLDRVSPVDDFGVYGVRVCAFYNYFQPALVLYELGALEVGAVFRVGAELVRVNAFGPDALVGSVFDLVSRGQLSPDLPARLINDSTNYRFAELSAWEQPTRRFVEELREVAWDQVAVEAVKPTPIDFVALLARDKLRAKEAKWRALRARRLIPR